MPKTGKTALLTDVELELMTVLWRLEEGFVRDILENLGPDRKLAYTSAATVMRILESKRFVSSEKRGRAHLYRPSLSKTAYQSRSLRDLSEKLFDDTPSALVARFVEDCDLSDDTLKELSDLIARRARK